MPRVLVKKKSTRGREISCGKCGKKIEPGMHYRQWSFRYGGTRYRCNEAACAPRPSDLTQSLMGSVYDALDDLQGAVPQDQDDAESLIQDCTNAAEEVKDQYEEAAESFGGEGPNRERADALEDFINELEGIETEKEDGESKDDYAERMVEAFSSLEVQI